SSVGRLHNTGEAAERPPMAIVIETRAEVMLCAKAAPAMPQPQQVPAISTVRRTELELKPRLISRSTRTPPISRPQQAATSQGAPVNRNDCRSVLCLVCTRYVGSHVRSR